MSAENPINVENLAGHLKRHFDGSEEQAQRAIERHLSDNPDATNAQIFHSLSEGKGSGKSHASAFVNHRDGTLKHKGRKLGIKRSKRSRRQFG